MIDECPFCKKDISDHLAGLSCCNEEGFETECPECYKNLFVTMSVIIHFDILPAKDEIEKNKVCEDCRKEFEWCDIDELYTCECDDVFRDANFNIVEI